MSHLNMSKSNPVTSSLSLKKLIPITFPCSCLFGTYSGFKEHTPYCTLSYTVSALDNWALTLAGIYYNVIVHNWVSFTKCHCEGHTLFVEISLISSRYTSGIFSNRIQISCRQEQHLIFLCVSQTSTDIRDTLKTPFG